MSTRPMRKSMAVRMRVYSRQNRAARSRTATSGLDEEVLGIERCPDQLARVAGYGDPGRVVGDDARSGGYQAEGCRDHQAEPAPAAQERRAQVVAGYVFGHPPSGVDLV